MSSKSWNTLLAAGSVTEVPTWWVREGSNVVQIGTDSLGKWMETFLKPHEYGEALRAFKYGKTRYTGWKKQLRYLLNKFGFEAHNGVGKVGNRTYSARSENLYRALQQLQDGAGPGGRKMNIELILNFRVRHVAALAEIWEQNNLAAKTRAVYLSELRVLARWIGKPHMIPSVPELGRIGLEPKHFETTTYAVRDKSPQAPQPAIESVPPINTQAPTPVATTGAQDADLATSEASPQLEGGALHPWCTDAEYEHLEKAYARMCVEEWRLELLMRMAHAFGMRYTEALCFQPHERIKADHVEIDEGSKGGRKRIVPIRHVFQRVLLERCLLMIKPGDSLSGKKQYTLKEARNHYRYLLKKCGVTCAGPFGFTPHSLRHEYLHGRYLDESGVPVPVKDPHAVGDPMRIKRAQQIVATEAGHNRTVIHTAYTGSPNVATAIRREAENAASQVEPAPKSS